MASLIRRRINKKITKALHDFPLIEEGDRVLVGVSGGKDPTTLLLELNNRRGKTGPHFELGAVHIQSDFADPSPRVFIKNLEKQLDIPFYYLDIGVERRLQEGFKLNCYWCSTQRRLELLEFARTHNFNKIALGHHMDDIVETLLMNMLYKGEISGMPPLVSYEKYPISIIRPLCYCEEEELRVYIKDAGLSQFTCTCNFSNNSHRKRIREEIKSLTQGNSTLKQNLFESMRHIKSDYLL